jgi:hypothetical protein
MFLLYILYIVTLHYIYFNHRLYYTEMKKIFAGHGNDNPESVQKKVSSILYSAQMVSLAANEVRKEPPFDKDPRTANPQFLFGISWAAKFLQRHSKSKHKNHAREKVVSRPSDHAIANALATLQEALIATGLPPENVFSVDETGIQVNAPFLHKYVTVGSGEKASDDADDKKRIPDMAGISVKGESLPPFMIIQCSVKGADLSKTRVCDSLLRELDDLYGEGVWEKRMWERNLKFPKNPTAVAFKRPYLFHKVSFYCFTLCAL